MEKKYLDSLISDEARGRAYLLGKCFPDAGLFCPRCRCNHLYVLAEGRYRCSQCQYTFHEFSGRWINRGRLSCTGWLTLAGLFEEGHPVSLIAAAMGMAYGTAYESVRTIRLSIAAAARDAEQVLGRSLFQGPVRRGERPREYREVPVFGIWWEGREVCACLLREFTAERLLGLDVAGERLGSIVFVRDFKGFEGLLFYEPWELRQYRTISFDDNGGPARKDDRFWRWAKRELNKYRGVSYWNFPLYLKELEFRFNRREADFLDNLMTCLCGLVPKLP